MRGVKIIAVVLAVIFLLIGFFFIVGAFSDNTKMVSRLVIGGVLLLVAGVLILLSRMKTEQVSHTYHQKIDLSGDIDLEQLKCRNCGGTLSEQNVSIQAGAVMVNCPYCDSVYQIKEAPKW